MNKVRETTETEVRVSEIQKIQDDLSPEERAEQICQFMQSPDDLRKLEWYLRTQIIKVKKGSYNDLEQELISKAIERLLEKDRRKWPKNLSAMKMIAQTARSILWDIRNNKDALAMNRTYEPACSEEDREKWIENNTSKDASNSHNACLDAKDTLEEIKDLFNDDQIALDVLYAKHAYGYTPEEIQEMLDLNPTEYASKLTKIKRRLAKLQKGGLGGNHDQTG